MSIKIPSDKILENSGIAAGECIPTNLQLCW